MTKDVPQKVKKMVADHLGVEEAKVTEEANFIDDLGADSLGRQPRLVVVFWLCEILKFQKNCRIVEFFLKELSFLPQKVMIAQASRAF